MIRLADQEKDMESILRGARAFAKQSGLEHLVADDLEPIFRGLFSLGEIRIYVAEEDGEIVGGIGLGIFPFMWNMGIKEMSELFFWVYPGAPHTTALKLMRRAMEDAKKECQVATFSTMPTSPDKVSRAYELFGFQIGQTLYRREF